MKSLIALGVGLVVALAPGTAFAAPADFGTGNGNAYGNCRHSSATGNHAPSPGSAGNGNGGHVVQGVKPSVPCAVPRRDPATPTTTASTGSRRRGDGRRRGQRRLDRHRLTRLPRRPVATTSRRASALVRKSRSSRPRPGSMELMSSSRKAKQGHTRRKAGSQSRGT